MQRFDTTDRLALEILADPFYDAVTGYPHLREYVLTDANGHASPWFWLSPLEGTTVEYGYDPGLVRNPFKLLLRAVTGQAGVYFTSQRIPRDPAATHATLLFDRRDSDGITRVTARVELYDDADVLLSTTAPSATLTASGEANVAGFALGAATYLKVRFTLDRAGGAALLAEDDVTLTDLSLVQGNVDDVAIGNYIHEPVWVDVLGEAGDLVVERNELDLGTLTATLYSETLDPALADTIRAGKRIRLNLLHDPGDPVDLIFDGEVSKATVAYDLRHPDPTKRTKITLTALDNVAALAAAPRPDGVSSIEELAYVLEGCGVAWSLNGEAGHIATTPPVVTRNVDAKALDQIAIIRDTVLGYAWVDRAGVAQVWDADQLPGLDPAAAVLDEAAYLDVDVDYDTDRCINIVTLKVLRLDPVTGDTEEVDFGPYVDLASRQKNGPHAATFTIQGVDEDPAALAAYAEAIFTANATPRRRLNAAALKLTTDADVDEWARLDLYDARRVANARADLDETARVAGLKHTITAGKRSSWLLEVDFAAEGLVAAPQQVPSPPPTGAKTLAQLLRPVGEVTAMMGLPSQVWPGWLVLNGDALTAGEYPDLEDWLAAAGLSTTVLPDLTDYLPVGAGIKALGAKTGAWTKTILEANLPNHTHGVGAVGLPTSSAAGSSAGRVARGTATDAGAISPLTGSTGGGAGASSPLDITPKVFGIYWIIRAKSGL